MRIFFNFSLLAAREKGLTVDVAGLPVDNKVCSNVAYALSANVTQAIGAGPYTYAWTSSCGGTFSAPGAANTNFTPANVSCNSSCIITCVVTDACDREAFFSQTLTINELTGGTIGADQTVCSGTVPDMLTETAAPSTTCNITYQWQKSTTNCSAGFSNIPSANSASYTPTDPVTQTTYFKRIVTVQNGSNCSATSNCVTILTQSCCQFTASCPVNTNLGTYNCTTLANIPAQPTTLAQLQAAPYNLTIGNTPCGQIKFTSSDNATPNICSPSNQTITRTIVVWDDLSPFNNVKDVNESSQTCTFTYVVQADLTSPTINCPANLTVDCPTAPVFGTPTANDACDGTPTISIESTTPAPVSGCLAYVATRVWRATDDCGNSANTCSQTITVRDNTAPQIVDIANYTLPGCNAAWPTLTTTWSDNCSSGGVITATPGNVTSSGCTESRVYTFTVMDACGNPDTETTTVTRSSSANPPQIVDIPNYTLPGCNPAWPTTLTTTWTGSCGGGGTITATAGTAQSSGCTQSRVYTFTVSNSCGSSSTETTTVYRTYDVTKPMFTAVPANVTVQCSSLPAVGTPVATDICGSVTIVYNGQTRTNGSCPDSYSLIRKWTATDNCGNTQTATQKVTVQDTQKPVFTVVPPNTTISCTDPIPMPGAAMATDNCDASVSILYLGEMTMGASCPGSYQIMRSWQATDNCGNWTTAAQIITVQDTQAPNFTSVPGNVTVQCSDLIPPIGNATATDNCSGPAQIVFLGQTRTDGSCLYNYTLTRTWRALDQCGNSKTASQVITVRDTQAPTFNSPPANVTVMCGCVPTTPAVTAQDNCGPATVAYQGEWQSTGNCSTGYTITRTWTAADLCGNPSTYTQTITVTPMLPLAPGTNTPLDRAASPERSGEAQLQDFHLIPNPATDWVSLNLENFIGEPALISVYNELGKLIWETRIDKIEDGLLPINLRQSNAPDGLYTVSLRSKEQIFTKRLVLIGLR